MEARRGFRHAGALETREGGAKLGDGAIECLVKANSRATETPSLRGAPSSPFSLILVQLTSLVASSSPTGFALPLKCPTHRLYANPTFLFHRQFVVVVVVASHSPLLPSTT